MNSKFKFYFITLLAIIVISACSGEKKNTENIDLNQVTYQEFYEFIFADYNNRVEWHNDIFNDEAKSSVDLIEKGVCDKKSSGNQIFVKNKSESDSVLVIVNTTFSIPGAPEYLATIFNLGPNEEAYLACTEFNFNENNFTLNHEIVVAEYLNK